MNKNVTIIGSGLAGPLLGILLAQKYNIKSNMYERNQDFRKTNKYSGRSINLALSERGINALRQANIYDSKFKKSLIPMFGRMIHDIDGKQSFQSYGNKKTHYINSVSRSEINRLLLNRAENTKKISIKFSSKCSGIDFLNNKLTINEKQKDYSGPVFGADGYKSAIAQKISKNIKLIDISHSYKELTIESKNNDFQLDPNSLHIWPRRNMMLIALPNNDKTFTCTLFMKTRGKNSFESFTNKSNVINFFEKNFIDIIDLIPNLYEYIYNNPLGRLITIDVDKWYYKDQACLIGDSAHAIVPFYGQGMNASLEDCVKLCELIDGDNNWESVFYKFNQTRKFDSDAISHLALKNYVTMRDSVLEKNHILKNELSLKLMDLYPNHFIPEYTMVSFTNIPYSIVEKRSQIQDTILDKIINKNYSIDQLKNEYVQKLIKSKLSKLNYV
tara:strand:- start:3173 stop:4504 length:1332 start_codon:yes stop_codon:yes gene_type:complete